MHKQTFYDDIGHIYHKLAHILRPDSGHLVSLLAEEDKAFIIKGQNSRKEMHHELGHQGK